MADWLDHHLDVVTRIYLMRDERDLQAKRYHIPNGYPVLPDSGLRLRKLDDLGSEIGCCATVISMRLSCRTESK